MGSRQSTMDYVLEQISQAGDVSAKKMFGEFGIYCDGRVVGFLCDDQLFVKITEAGRQHIAQPKEGLAYPGAKPSFLIDGDLWEDREWLSTLIRRTAAEIPLPKPKSAPSSTAKAKATAVPAAKKAAAKKTTSATSATSAKSAGAKPTAKAPGKAPSKPAK
ncbi:TfoX/Sxy family protein [Roseateles amylovorans]|uniref:TfoX/Sxy family protein n=1 Tax=Roseateles amylovorans TaxID=2978473 RepID=UPI00338DD4FA